MNTEMLERFKVIQDSESAQKESIVARLLGYGQITTTEAATLLKSMTINLTAENLEVSSGGKILGGSDFESNNYR